MSYEGKHTNYIEKGTWRKEHEENPENYEQLESLLKNIAEEMNREFKDYLDPEKTGDLFEKDCSIRMNAFQRGENGPYKKEKIKKDKKLIKEKELEWSDAENEKVRNYYKDKYKAWDDTDTKEVQIEKTIQRWEELQKKRIGNLLEMAIVGIFYKVLKDSKFSIMRSAKYDDYENGVDTIIVNKETGKVICAFDEVSDDIDKKERREEKLKRIRNHAKEHGAELKYGITFEKGEKGSRVLVKKHIKDTPMFCLNLSKDELKRVLHEMEFDINKNPPEAELSVFNKMVKLMAKQTKNLLDQEYINKNVKENLQEIPKALEEMRNTGLKYKMRGDY